MKKILLLSCAVLMSVQFSNAQENRGSAKDVAYSRPQDQKFIDMEKALWDAWKSKDRKAYEDLLSDKFFEVDVTGTYDKATEISEMGKCNLRDYAILDPQVRHLNDQTALLSYTAVIHDICEGKPVPEHQTINVLFVREKGNWVKVLDTEVPLSTPPNKASDITAPNSNDESTLIELEKNWAKSTADPDEIARFIEENVTPDYRYTARMAA